MTAVANRAYRDRKRRTKLRAQLRSEGVSEALIDKIIERQAWDDLVARVGLAEAQAARKRQTGAERIAAERQRQIEVEGWDVEHDQGHAEDGSGTEALVWAAISYATPPADRRFEITPYFGESDVPIIWPWHPKWWKPGDRIRELEKAGALIAAEIDRVLAADTGKEQ